MTTANNTPAVAAEPARVVATMNELILLKCIAKTARGLKVDPTEMAVPFENPFENKHVGSGTFASCLRKGLVTSQDYGTKDHAVSLTQAGLECSRRRLPHED